MMYGLPFRAVPEMLKTNASRFDLFLDNANGANGQEQLQNGGRK